jgi:NTP pyrophosphatase (non-canonical NTP hydrolase)
MSNQAIQDQVLMRVLQERERQVLKHGPKADEHPPEKWLVILAEEFGEVSKALNENDPLEYYTELIQVAAVAIAAAENYLRNGELYGRGHFESST